MIDVKMVHNGIEYGDMQLIAESYDLMKQILGLSVDEPLLPAASRITSTIGWSVPSSSLRVKMSAVISIR
jgi:6-phosphogluconate dehydrogenase (decarboxylating)